MAWKKLGVTGCLDATDVVWINEIWCPGVKDDHSSLLYNLKKPTDRKGKFEWNYKEEAITKCSEFLNDFPKFKGKNPVIIPMPPSKKKGSIEYDDRLVQIINKVENAICLDIFDVKESVKSTHTQDQAKDLTAIQSNLEISENVQIPNLVYVLDDVFTTGAHFKAIKNKILEKNPNAQVIGLFFFKPEGEDYYNFIREY